MKDHKVLNWIGDHCRLPLKAGKPYARQPIKNHWLDFQKEIITEIFNPDGSIRKNECFLYGCRKVSKTWLYAAISYFLISDREGFEMPIVAYKFSQGLIPLKFVKSLIKLDGKEDLFNIRKDHIEHKEKENKIYVVFNEKSGNFGEQPDAALFDEIGNYKTGGLQNMEPIETGMSLSKDKLILKASNPPDDKTHPVLSMLKASENDPDCYVKKFCAGIKDDWESEKTWRINPFIDRYFKTGEFDHVYKDYKKKAKVARENKEKEISFRRLLLGQGISVKAQEFIPVEKIKDIPDSMDIYNNQSLRLAFGIDLSAVRDATALSAVFYNEDTEDLFIKPFIYYPNVEKRRASEKLKLRRWHDKGFIKIQDKPVTDKGQIVSDFQNFIYKYGLSPEAISFDPALASHWYEDFREYNPKKVHYSGREMTGSIRELQRIGVSGKLHVLGGNEATRWQFNNCLVSEKSKNYCLLDRATVQQSIDFPVATAIGFKHILDNKKSATEGFIAY